MNLDKFIGGDDSIDLIEISEDDTDVQAVPSEEVVDEKKTKEN